MMALGHIIWPIDYGDCLKITWSLFFSTAATFLKKSHFLSENYFLKIFVDYFFLSLRVSSCIFVKYFYLCAVKIIKMP